MPFQKGHKINLGKKFPERGKNISMAKKAQNLIEDKAPKWLGDKVGYNGVHAWVKKWIGKPKICGRCGTDKPKVRFELANLDHKYKRVLEDYMYMCSGCHAEYDKSMGFRKWKNKNHLYV